MSSPLFDSYLRAARAQKHFDDLIDLLAPAMGDHLDKAVDSIHLNDALQVTNPPFTHAPSYLIPEMAGVLTGELVQNLRIALDYLVFALARKDSGVEQAGTQFLIEDSAKNFANNAPRRLKGLSSAHQEAIEALQPYKGTDWTRQLRDLSNPDKHRKLFDHGVQVHMKMSREYGPPGTFANRVTRYGQTFETYDSGPKQHVYVDFHPTAELMYEGVGGLMIPLIPRLQDLILKVPETLEIFEPEFYAAPTD